MRLARLMGLALVAILGPNCNESGITVSDGGGGGGNQNQGWLTITTPTTGSTYWTDGWSVTLGGEAFIDAWSYSGEVAPPVRWTNASAGVSGTAIDDVTWGYLFGTVYPVRRQWWATVPLVGGTNSITVSATSGSNSGVRTLKVKRPSGSILPEISIDPFVPGDGNVTNTSPLVLRGDASSYLGIGSVTWANSTTGHQGSATGTTSWTASVPLVQGSNSITVTARDTAGQAATASVTVRYDPSQSGPFPAAPTDVVAGAGDRTVSLSWSPVSGALSYNVYWATAPGVLKTTYRSLPGGNMAGGQSPQLFTGLTNGTTYYFVVTAVDAVGEGVESAEVSAMPYAGPTAPVTLEATEVSASGARLNGSLLPPEGFQTTAWFEYGTSPSFGLSTPATLVPAGAPATVSADLSGLAGAVTYYFRLVTQNAAGTFAGGTRAFYAPVPPVILATGLDAGLDLRVDSTHLYWVEVYGGAVKKIPIDGGDVTVLAATGGAGNDANLDIDATTATFSDYWKIWQVPLAGGPLVNVVSGRKQITRLRTWAGAIYWREEGAVFGMDAPGGTITTIATGDNLFQGGLAVDATGVYWTDYWGGLIQRAPLGGGPITTLASGLDRPLHLILDAGMLYFMEGTAIRKVPAAGGAVTSVVSGISPAIIAKDSTCIYWGDAGNAVKKVNLATGASTTLHTGETGFTGMAVDGTSVYWITPGSRYFTPYGTLKKIPKG